MNQWLKFFFFQNPGIVPVSWDYRAHNQALNVIAQSTHDSKKVRNKNILTYNLQISWQIEVFAIA